MRSPSEFTVWRHLLGMRPGSGRISACVLLTVALLAGCQLPALNQPTREPTVEVARRHNPTPTIQIVSSEELYGDDGRAVGETSRGLASFPAGAVLPPVATGLSERGVKILLDATSSISGELYQTNGPRQPGVLLLGDDISAWRTLPIRLSQSGYVALVLKTDAMTQSRQLETMLQSLIAIPNVDAGVIAVVGEGRAADLAALGCAVNSLCDALALLSPLSRDTLLNMLPSFGNRPLWLAAANDDAEAHNTASALAEAAQGEAQFVSVNEGRGAAMLDFQPTLEDELVAWLQSHLVVR